MNINFIVPAIIFLTLSLLIGSCINFEKTCIKTSTNSKTISNNTTSAGILALDCQDKNYRMEISDYIIEGIVDDVCYALNRKKNGILTRVSIKINKYTKGKPLDTEKIELFIPGGTIGNITQIGEENPVFRKGERIRVYISKSINGKYQIICSNLGVELLHDLNILDTGN